MKLSSDVLPRALTPCSLEFHLRFGSPYTWLRLNSVFIQNACKCKTVIHLSRLELRFGDSFTLLDFLASVELPSLQKCETVIRYAPQKPPAVVVGTSPSFRVPAHTAALEPFRFSPHPKCGVLVPNILSVGLLF